jgi:hypothetical protein
LRPGEGVVEVVFHEIAVTSSVNLGVLVGGERRNGVGGKVYFSGRLVMFACCTCGMSEGWSSRISISGVWREESWDLCCGSEVVDEIGAVESCRETGIFLVGLRYSMEGHCFSRASLKLPHSSLPSNFEASKVQIHSLASYF